MENESPNGIIKVLVKIPMTGRVCAEDESHGNPGKGERDRERQRTNTSFYNKDPVRVISQGHTPSDLRIFCRSHPLKVPLFPVAPL